MSSENDRSPAVLILLLWLSSTMFWWGFAFAPLPDVRPEWLEAAKNACFGTLLNGLPDSQGWLMLIGAPLMLLAAILTGWRRDLSEGLRSALRRPAGVILIAVLVTAALWQSAWTAGRIRAGLEFAAADFSADADGPLPAEYPRSNKPAPAFELVDQSGARVSPESVRGKPVILTFAFAHCQTVCPMLVKQSLQALESLDPAKARLLVITLDPWRDTPGSLPSLADKWEFPKNAHVLSGEVPLVTAALDAYEVPWKRDEKTGDIAHPALTYVLDANGRIAYTFNNAAPSWIADAVRRLGEYAGN